MDLYKLDELNCSILSSLLPLFERLPFCKFIRNKLLRIILFLEGGTFNSYILRKILSQKLMITFGSYSYGNKSFPNENHITKSHLFNQ